MLERIRIWLVHILGGVTTEECRIRVWKMAHNAAKDDKRRREARALIVQCPIHGDQCALEHAKVCPFDDLKADEAAVEQAASVQEENALASMWLGND